MTITVLNTTLDKQGTEVSIKFTTSVQLTPVIPFFLKNFSELINLGYAHSHVPHIGKDTKAVYAEIDGQVVGHIVFNYIDDLTKTAWIVLSAVDSNYRGRGIYNLMHTQFETVIKSQGSRKIASYVHVDNLPRQASCASVGMKPFYLRMEKNL